MPGSFARIPVAAVLSVAMLVTCSCAGNGKSAGNDDSSDFSAGEPVAIFEPDCYVVYAGEYIFFDGSGSFDNDNEGEGREITRWEWDWSYGREFVRDDEGGPITTHAWDEPGEYVVMLRVTDNDGQTGCCEAPVQVSVLKKVPEIIEGEVSRIKIVPFPQRAEQSLEFSVECGAEGDHILDSGVEWDWNGDGDYSDADRGLTVRKSWEKPGRYNGIMRAGSVSGFVEEIPFEVVVVEELRQGIKAAEAAVAGSVSRRAGGVGRGGIPQWLTILVIMLILVAAVTAIMAAYSIWSKRKIRTQGLPPDMPLKSVAVVGHDGRVRDGYVVHEGDVRADMPIDNEKMAVAGGYSQLVESLNELNEKVSELESVFTGLIENSEVLLSGFSEFLESQDEWRRGVDESIGRKLDARLYEIENQLGFEFSEEVTRKLSELSTKMAFDFDRLRNNLKSGTDGNGINGK